MATYAVYLDVVLLLNFVLDYLLLWATARFGQLETGVGRLVPAALLGAGYVVLPFFAVGNGTFLDFFFKILVSALMVLVAYRWRGLWGAVQALVYFYLVAFAMAGAMLGAIYLFQGQGSSYDLVNGLFAFLGNVRYTWLLAAVAAAVVLARWGGLFIKKNFLHSIYHVPVVIRCGEQRLALKALVDTGNQLRDPLTAQPVMVAEYAALRPLLPPGLRQTLETSANFNLEEVAASVEDSAWAARLRLIPFTSLGQNRGLLLGFHPDEVVVVTDNRLVKIKDIVVGISQDRLSSQGSYRALLHPDILQVAL